MGRLKLNRCGNFHELLWLLLWFACSDRKLHMKHDSPVYVFRVSLILLKPFPIHSPAVPRLVLCSLCDSQPTRRRQRRQGHSDAGTSFSYLHSCDLTVGRHKITSLSSCFASSPVLPGILGYFVSPLACVKSG